MRTSGTVFCLASAAAFGAMAVFGKLAYGQGATVGTLLAVRFALAATLLWLVLLARGGVAQALRATPRRDLALAVGLGALGYAAQAGAFFAALDRIDAGLLSLILYTYPALVTVAALLLGRERVSRRRVGALALASGGLVLVLAGAGTGALEPVGVALALTASVVYTAYILVGEGVSGRMPAGLLAALVCTGAAVTLAAGAALTGQLRPGALTASGWGWLAALAAISTVGAIGLFFAGLRRVGPVTAAILSTVEPVVTVALAWAAFGETLGPGQLAGGALVLGSVVMLNLRRRQTATAAPAPSRSAAAASSASPSAPATMASAPICASVAGGSANSDSAVRRWAAASGRAPGPSSR